MRSRDSSEMTRDVASIPDTTAWPHHSATQRQRSVCAVLGFVTFVSVRMDRTVVPFPFCSTTTAVFQNEVRRGAFFAKLHLFFQARLR